MILFEKKYQTFDTVFHHQMKHCISCLIYYILCIHGQTRKFALVRFTVLYKCGFYQRKKKTKKIQYTP